MSYFGGAGQSHNVEVISLGALSSDFSNEF